MTLHLAPSPWRTDTFRRLNNRLENVVGAKTAKQFEPLKVWTVGDLMRHAAAPLLLRHRAQRPVPSCSEGEEVTVLAEVVDARVFNVYDRVQEGAAGGHHHRPPRDTWLLTFFGQPRLITYWQNALQPGARGIFAGKVKEFNRKLQLAHPDFVILDADGAIIGGAARNSRPGPSRAEPVDRALPADRQAPHLDGRRVRGPRAGLACRIWPTRCRSWVRAEAGVLDLETAFRAVHQPADRAAIEPGRDRLRFDEAFALQLTMAYRRADAAQSWCGAPRPQDRWAAGRLRRAAAVRADRAARSRSASRS